MPLVKVLNHVYVTYRNFSHIYWVEITKMIRYSYGYNRIDQPELVKQALKEIFNYLIDSFQIIINTNRNIGLLLFVHKIHESSVMISYESQHDNKEVFKCLSEQDINELPSIRRVLKLIMEELLIESFDEEINPKVIEEGLPTEHNINILEELIYIGSHALEIAEYINIASIFNKSVVLRSSRKDRLVVFFNSPYNKLFETIKKNMLNYSTQQYPEVDKKLNEVLKNAFCINLEDFLNSLPQALGSYITPKEEFINEQNLGTCSKEDSFLFYKGLTLNNTNKMPVDQSFIKMQENNRLMYRPIIEFKDKHGNEYWIIGYGKAFESIYAIRTNAVLWSKLPIEWKHHELIKQFENDMEAFREQTMMDQIAAVLDNKNLKYDKDIKSLKNLRGQGYSITTAGLGQIDLIFLNEQHKKIYVCECKNNRPRFDLYNWKSDYEQFTRVAPRKRNYEKQLTGKYDWALNNKKLIQDHFNYIYNSSFNFDDWSVEGLFILMSASIYKYDGLFLTITVQDLVEFIENSFSYTYGTLRFEKRNGSWYELEYPYLKNVNRMIEEGVL